MPFLKDAHGIDLRHAHLNDIGGNQFYYYSTNTDERALAPLNPAIRQGYFVPRCMEGTRESVFKKIDDWLEDFGDTTPNIVWISGSPGAGKSAVASTLVSNLAKSRRLGSFFFFKRGDATLGDPTALWRTVAFDLAQFHPDMKHSVVEFLSRPGFREADIMLHFECMIEGALVQNQKQLSVTPPVVIIDALDECGQEDSLRGILLDTLNHWSRLPRSFKLIVTSRNERVPSSFYDRRVCRKITLETGNSVGNETRKDIRIFFEQSFDSMRPNLGLPSAWPADPVLSQLTERAAGLFIWAKTAMAFMSERRGRPTAKLELILAGNLGQRTDSIDTLYRQILDFSFQDSDDSTLELFRAIVGAIIVAKTPLLLDDLKHFLQIPDGEGDWEFRAILHSLSSVIELDGLLHLTHLSFAEFLTNANRCYDHRFIIDQVEQHRKLTRACLRVMKTDLKFNICELETSYIRNDDVEDLPERMATSIPTRLSYSCRFWAAHLSDTTADRTNCYLLVNEVKDFFYTRLLYWLEVMSLIKEVAVSSIWLLTVARWSKGLDLELSDFARDASRFITNFHTPISESAPHIYLSALPFSPQKSMISKRYLSQFSHTLSIAVDRDDHWPALVNILSGHTKLVSSVAYSPDGKRLVSGSEDMTVRVWCVETGDILGGPFKGHTGRVWSVAYSPDGKRVASGSSDKTLRVWDVETGEIIAGPFEGHTGIVLSVAYSPDGRRVVSGSEDMTVRVWDVESGKIEAGPFEGHTYLVCSVAYSPDGKRVVSGSADNTICVWDVESGKIVAGPFEGHIQWVRSVAYSPNGKQVVSGSSDGTVCVWDAETGAIVAGPFEGHTGWVQSVAYSPDGKQVVSGSVDKTVVVWDVETGKIVAGPFEGHTGQVWSVGYSPDGKQVASGSDDNTIRIWDIGPIVAGPFQPHTEQIFSVAYSPNGKRVASGSADKTVRVWDVETGKFAAGPFQSHDHRVLSLAYSPDGKRIVSGSDDTMVCVWDVETGEIVAGPFQGHTDGVKSVAYSSDGRRVASGSDDKTVRVWDVETGDIVAGPFEGHTHWIQSVAYSSDGKRVVSGSVDTTVLVWDVETGKVVAGPLKNTDQVLSVAYSPYRKQVVSGCADSTICVWDVETGNIVTGPFKAHTDQVSSVAYSPDGRWIVSGSVDNTVCVWDVDSGRIVAGPFKNHTSYVHSVVYSPDGKRVASGSADRTICVWDVESGQIMAGALEIPNNTERHLTTLYSIGGPNIFGSFSPNGWISSLGSTSEKPDGSILFWVPPHARRGLCDGKTLSILGIPSTRLDLSRFVHGTSWMHCHSMAISRSF